MADKRNVIEINGRRYDAATGKPVSSSEDQAISKIHSIPSGPTTKKSSAKNLHKKVKKSTTLNRAATKKPKQSMDIAPAKKASPEKTLAKNTMSTQVSPDRKSRAKLQPKSKSISKFSSASTLPVHTELAEADDSTKSIEKVVGPTQSIESNQVRQKLVAERLRASEGNQETTEKKGLRAWIGKRPKLVTILSTSAASVLLLGYITYLNIPNMALRVAASRAGFEANMPGYRPNGFSFAGPISYSPGQITIAFHSNTDDREYTITERETNWDSQSLLENFVKAETDLYSTFQERGLTVYIYEGSNAAWVNGGIWYTVEGDSLLNSEQLLKIATSI